MSFKTYITIILVFCSVVLVGCFSKANTLPSAAILPTQALSTPNRLPTFPFGDPSQFQYAESDCAGDMIDMGKCTKGEAYKSARDLDTLLFELDSQFPDGAWEKALEDVILPQEKWESLKYSSCEFFAEDYLGGTNHGNAIINCVMSQNKDRINRLITLICMETEGFSRCPKSKPGGEVPSITAVPILPTP